MPLLGGLCLACAVVAAAAQTALDWPRLRALRGHFDGAAWLDEVDRWDGAKHRVMRELSTALVRQRASRPQWRARLGQPDRQLNPGTPEHARALQGLSQACPGGRAPGTAVPLMLYAWRGQHDQLVLWLQRGRVAGCAWLYAWE